MWFVARGLILSSRVSVCMPWPEPVGPPEAAQLRTFAGASSATSSSARLAGRRAQNRFAFDRPDLAQLDTYVVEARAARLGAKTAEVYGTGWKSFVDFATYYLLEAEPPVSPRTIARWAVYEIRVRRPTFATLRTYAAAVASAHEDAGEASPLDSALVEGVMKGLRRSFPAELNRKSPIAPTLLVRLLNILAGPALDPSNGTLNAMLRAMYAIAFAALLRKGEVLALAGKHVVKCTMQGRHGLEVTIARSKTDIFGKSVRVKLACQCPSPACPAKCWEDYEHARGRPVEANEPAWQGYGYRALLKHLRKLLALAGEKPEEYAGHSFRRGAAQALAEMGIATHLLKRAGRWVSEAYQAYLAESTGASQEVAALLRRFAERASK